MMAPASGIRTVHELDRTTRALRSPGRRILREARVGSPCLVRSTSPCRNPHAPHSSVVCRASPKYGMSRAIERMRRGASPHMGQDASRAISLMGDRSPAPSGTSGKGRPSSIILHLAGRSRRKFKYGMPHLSIQLQVN